MSFAWNFVLLRYLLILTHFCPIHPVYTPWNHKKQIFFDDFRDYKIGTLGRSGLSHFKTKLNFHAMNFTFYIFLLNKSLLKSIIDDSHFNQICSLYLLQVVKDISLKEKCKDWNLSNRAAHWTHQMLWKET